MARALATRRVSFSLLFWVQNSLLIVELMSESERANQLVLRSLCLRVRARTHTHKSMQIPVGIPLTTADLESGTLKLIDDNVCTL